jgi:hypothetical protein
MVSSVAVTVDAMVSLDGRALVERPGWATVSVMG